MPFAIANPGRASSASPQTGTTSELVWYTKDLLPGSSYAAVVYTWHGISTGPDVVEQKYYYQSTSGAIFETTELANKSYTQREILAAGIAAYGTPLAATVTPDPSIKIGFAKNQHIKVYYITKSGTIAELVSKEGTRWSDGPLNPVGLQPAPYSKLSAVSWTEGNRMLSRLYYQATNDFINEHLYQSENGSEQWRAGSTLPGTPLRGSALSFVNRNQLAGPPLIRGYYQDVLGPVSELVSDNWSPYSLGQFNINPAPFLSQFAATVTITLNDATPRLSLFTLSLKNTIIEYINRNGWYLPTEIDTVAVLPGSKLAANNGATYSGQIRVYASGHTNNVAQRSFDGTNWADVLSNGTSFSQALSTITGV